MGGSKIDPATMDKFQYNELNRIVGGGQEIRLLGMTRDSIESERKIGSQISFSPGTRTTCGKTEG